MSDVPAEDLPLVVVLDDEPNMGKVLTKLLRLQELEVRSFESPRDAVDFLRENRAAVLLSDLRMPEMTGEEVLELVNKENLAGEVIMMTAYGTIESAMRCVRAGAYDYVTKPFDTKALIATVKRAVDDAVKSAPRKASEEYVAADNRYQLVGESASLREVRELIRRIAASQSAVLIIGESGTGKELVARAIHRNSPRAKNSFVAINCASIPETLMESELFGHEKGAFTGAEESRAGLMEVASGGTLFLDEIGEMPLRLQSKLLRALQEREITRVGAVKNIHVDIRIVAATNRDLGEAVKKGEFREDLFYRLNVLRVSMPPLRERADDIPLLVSHFMEDFRERLGRPELDITQELVGTLQKQPWRGNVRELRNVVERLAVLSENDLIDQVHYQRSQQAFGSDNRTDTSSGTVVDVDSGDIPEFRDARDRFEAEYLRQVLQACEGNVTEAAKRSGMSRRNFYDKIEKLKIDVSEFKG